MSKHAKLLFQILRGLSDANIEFDELCGLLKYLGFEFRVRGSHHIFSLDGIPVQINLQRGGAKAKPYQVRQVRVVVIKYKLGREA